MSNTDRSSGESPKLPRETFLGRLLITFVWRIRHRSLALTFVTSLLFLGLALLFGWLGASFAQPSEGVVFRRVSCAEAAALIEAVRDESASEEWVVVLADQARLYADESGPAELGRPFVLSCDGIELAAEGNLFPGSPGIGSTSPSTLLVHARSSDTLWIERICIACGDTDIEGEGASMLLGWALRVASGLFGMLSLVMMLAMWLARRRSLPTLLGRAPQRASESDWEAPMTARLVFPGGDSPTDLDGPFWSVRKGVPVPVEATSEPRLELPFAGAAFRSGRAAPPLLVGPGRVNGLEVPEGESTPLQHGDVVKLGGSHEMAFETPEHTSPTLRYHLSGAAGLRFVSDGGSLPRRALFMSVLVLGIAATAVFTVQMGAPFGPYLSFLLLLLFCFGGWTIPPVPGLRWIELEEENGVLRGSAAGSMFRFDQVLLVEQEGGEYELIVSDSEGGSELRECSNLWARDSGPAAEALRRAMLEEARMLARE